MTARIYRGCIIERAGLNSSGIRWTARTPYGTARADTLAGVKRVITQLLNSKKEA